MIPLIKSTFFHEDDTKQALTTFLSHASILSFNEQCQTFEQNFSQYQNRKEAIFVNSGSSANLAILQALLNLGHLQHGDAVGFSAITWSTNVMPLLQLGLKPIPVDVELDTLNVSSRTLATTMETTPLKALFLTNLLGLSDDIAAITQLCKEKNTFLLEDNCESLGSETAGKKLGNFGIASTFSFYVGHHLSTIEGGMICTDDSELAAMLRIVRAHGWDRNLSVAEQQKVRKKHQINSTFYSRYTFYDLGYNLRPTEINGFLGNTQLPYIEEIILRRQQNFARFAHLYLNADWYYPLRTEHMEVFSNFAVPLVTRSAEQRKQLVAACHDKVEIRPIVGGDMTQQPFFQKHVPQPDQDYDLPNTRLIHQNGLYFGNNPELTEDDIQMLLSIFDRSTPQASIYDLR